MSLPATPIGHAASLVTVAFVAIGLGWFLMAVVDRLAGRRVESRLFRLLSHLAFMGGAVALAWWELFARGQVPLPGGLAAPADGTVLLSRYAAHLALFTLLAAAAWIDIRQRVIPDEITVPGLMLGLCWIGIHPDVLLPVATEVPRSFAVPRLEPDVLGAFGSLHAGGVPAWLGARPALGGLLAAALAFLAWWASCTTPAAESRGRPLRDPRLWAAGLGLAIITLAWTRGASHWAGVWAALIGVVVAGAIVWLTRIGASWALGREALGFGDVTLMAMAGSWLGWQASLLACCLAVFIGLVHGFVQLARCRENELPFGPSLCLAIVIVVVAWRPLWARAAPFFERPGELAVVVAAVIGLTAVSLLVWRRIRGGGAEPA